MGSYGSTESTPHESDSLIEQQTVNHGHEGTTPPPNDTETEETGGNDHHGDTVDTTCFPCCMGDVTCRWIARILLFVLVTASLFASRISFAILVAQFGSELNDSNRTNLSAYGVNDACSQSDGVFWLLLIAVCVPYALNLLRCAYRGLAKLRGIPYPWPSRREIAWVCGCVGHHVWPSFANLNVPLRELLSVF